VGEKEQGVLGALVEAGHDDEQAVDPGSLVVGRARQRADVAQECSVDLRAVGVSWSSD